MTFEPVLPAAILVVVAIVLGVARVVVLRRVLRSSARKDYLPVSLRWGGLTFAVLLLTVAAARPSVGGAASDGHSMGSDPGLNVFFVVDRSVASRVEDFGDRTPRMAGIRDDITALIDEYAGARFAVISFASGADLDWPLSEDNWSLEPMIAGLSTYPTASPEAMFEVDAAAGSGILRYELEQTAENFPGSKSLVFYFGSGADGSRAPQGDFDVPSVAGGAVLGYGTVAGGPVPQEIINGEVRYPVDAQSGAELRSAINEPSLTTIADQLGVEYFHRDSGGDIAWVVSAVDADNAASQVSQRIELYWALALAAAVLVLAELYLTIRRFRRNRVVRQEVSQ